MIIGRIHQLMTTKPIESRKPQMRGANFVVCEEKYLVVCKCFLR
jgi:hypothetical protein